jgi:hypothetical protein
MVKGTKWSAEQRRKFKSTMAKKWAEKAQGRDVTPVSDAPVPDAPAAPRAVERPRVPQDRGERLDELLDQLEALSIHDVAYLHRTPSAKERLLDAARILVEALA